MTDPDVFQYQQEAWSRSDVAGYSELIDMTDVTEIAVPSTDRVRDLATLSASMDDKKSVSRFAIVAPSNVAFGLGRMYQTYRTLDSRSTKEIGVFRTMPEALAFLDIPTSLRMPELP